MTGSSSAQSYACFGCVNFANNQRTATYHAWACANGLYDGSPPIIDLCSCPDDDAVFVDPITDNVCWYDPQVPESAEFLGLVINKITGLRASTFTREVIDGFLEGSVLQRPHKRGRSFGFEAFILSTSCEGRDYGLEWLRKLLEEDDCPSVNTCASCAGRELTIRKFCSTDDPADDGLHVWQSAGLVDGIVPIEPDTRKLQSCCTLTGITFTMQSESPFSYSQTAMQICDLTADPDGFVRCYDWANDCLDCQEDCCDRCGFDGLCQCYSPTVIEPDIVAADTCFCTPWAQIIDSCCVDGLPSGYDTAFKIDVYSGTDFSNDVYREFGMRNYTLQIFDNPLGLPCITDLETYDLWCSRSAPCAEIQIAYVPSDSTLTIDGRNNRVTLVCDGKCRNYDQVVTSVVGSLFPLVSRCQPIMIVSKWDAAVTQTFPEAPGIAPATVSVDSYLRFRN